MFSIGDFAKLGRVSVRMLRHYDVIGLLPPAAVDRFTGYRSYSADQLATLNRVIALKDLGFTLDQVRDLLEDKPSVDELHGMLRLRRAQLTAQLEADGARLTRVEARLRLIETEGVMPETDVVLKKIVPVRMVQLSDVAESFATEDIAPVIRPLCQELASRMTAGGMPFIGPCIAWYEPTDADKVGVHATMPFKGASADGLTVAELPSVEQAATVIHTGSMDTVERSYQALAHWIENNGYRARDGHARELYVHYSENVDEWVTELQIPVAKT